MVKKQSRWLCGFFAGLCAAVIFHAPAQAEIYYDSIVSDGAERRFIVHTPEDAREGEPLPTVVALHGALMSGKSMSRIFGMEDLAERGRFVVVYPDGQWRRWKDGRVPDQRGASDVLFMEDLADYLVEERIADPRRIYLTGVSNGGMLVYRVACETSDLFAAYSAILANMPQRLIKRCPGRGTAPMLIINATDDPIMPYEGGRIGRWKWPGAVLSTRDTVDFWRRHNGCSNKTEQKPLPDKDPADGSTIHARQFSDCAAAGAVVLFTIEGGGHVPPGAEIGDRPLLQSMLGGAPNQDISAADVSWKFFKRFPL